jgi:hypothetical protein
MTSRKYVWTYLLTYSLVVILQPLRVVAQMNSNPSQAIQPPERDGQHDFDFEIGTWKSHGSRLVHPLTGSKTWVEFDGTSVVRPVWNGRANLVQLEADDPVAGHIEICPFVYTIPNPISGVSTIQAAKAEL